MTFANFHDPGVPHSQPKRKLINISGERGICPCKPQQQVAAATAKQRRLKQQAGNTITVRTCMYVEHIQSRLYSNAETQSLLGSSSKGHAFFRGLITSFTIVTNNSVDPTGQ